MVDHWVVLMRLKFECNPPSPLLKRETVDKFGRVCAALPSPVPCTVRIAYEGKHDVHLPQPSTVVFGCAGLCYTVCTAACTVLYCSALYCTVV